MLDAADESQDFPFPGADTIALHDGSGQYVTHINFHANAGIETNGRPENLPRTECAERQFQAVKSLAQNKKDGSQVVVSGDLNVDYGDDRAYGYAKFPWKVFEANELPNLRSTYNMLGVKGTGTHSNNRHIDRRPSRRAHPKPSRRSPRNTGCTRLPTGMDGARMVRSRP